MLVLLSRYGGHCCGYANGCQCPTCQKRSQDLATGKLYYDQEGKLKPREPKKQPWAA